MKVLKPLHHSLWLFLAVGLVFGIASPPSAAQAQPQSQTKSDSDITRRELRNFDQFLDSHPEVAEALRKDPNLINNPNWVSNHRELKDWLEDHPNAREELKENPTAFVRREKGFEKQEGKEGDINRGELHNLDQFLDSHPEVAEALRNNPNLINNPDWVSKHPELKDWLEDHPNAREELKENPTAFVRREKGFEKQEGKEGDINRGELHNFDQFLDSHSEIAEGLRKNPNLINNPNWVSKHPELKDWLEDHPNAREELKENPTAFVRREKGFEKQEGKEGDITGRELRIFDQYLDNHSEAAEALSRNPNLINNPDWLNKHPELKEWLENHPYASKKLKENPRAFMRRERNIEKHDVTERNPVKP